MSTYKLSEGQLHPKLQARFDLIQTKKRELEPEVRKLRELGQWPSDEFLACVKSLTEAERPLIKIKEDRVFVGQENYKIQIQAGYSIVVLNGEQSKKVRALILEFVQEREDKLLLELGEDYLVI